MPSSVLAALQRKLTRAPPGDRSQHVKLVALAGVYHEKQEKDLCALHALNNLLQKPVFSRQKMDEICFSLCADKTRVTKHRLITGFGNYDINVIMAALQMTGYETIWFDKRRFVDGLVMPKIRGFILNVPTELRVGFIHVPLRLRHWICVRRVGSTLYFNLDSKLDEPELIGEEEGAKVYLRRMVACKDTELLVIVDGDVAEKRAWYASASASDAAPT